MRFAEDARKRINDKGWKEVTITNKEGKEVKLLTCKGCSRLLLDAQAKKDGEEK